MLEPEIAFADLDSAVRVFAAPQAISCLLSFLHERHVHFPQSMQVTLAEACLQGSITALMADSDEDLNFFRQWIDETLVDRLRTATKGCFPRITYTQAIRELARRWREVRRKGLSSTWFDFFSAPPSGIVWYCRPRIVITAAEVGR